MALKWNKICYVTPAYISVSATHFSGMGKKLLYPNRFMYLCILYTHTYTITAICAAFHLVIHTDKKLQCC
jgi:hypothetical protein